MTFEEISQFLIAPFIYENVTDEEYEALAVSHFVTFIQGIRIVGANVEIESLSAKLVEQPAAQ